MVGQLGLNRIKRMMSRGSLRCCRWNSEFSVDAQEEEVEEKIVYMFFSVDSHIL